MNIFAIILSYVFVFGLLTNSVLSFSSEIDYTHNIHSDVDGTQMDGFAIGASFERNFVYGIEYKSFLSDETTVDGNIKNKTTDDFKITTASFGKKYETDYGSLTPSISYTYKYFKVIDEVIDMNHGGNLTENKVTEDKSHLVSVGLMYGDRVGNISYDVTASVGGLNSLGGEINYHYRMMSFGIKSSMMSIDGTNVNELGLVYKLNF